LLQWAVGLGHDKRQADSGTVRANYWQPYPKFRTGDFPVKMFEIWLWLCMRMNKNMQKYANMQQSFYSA